MPLSPAQKVVFKADIIAKQANGQPLFGVTNEQIIADHYNALASPAFVVWKSSVTTREVGDAMNSTEVGGLTTAASNRLMVMEAYSGGTFSPGRADTRAGFDGVFSGAGGVLTRAALLALYKRSARVLEKLFATGAGSDAVPAALVVEGTTTPQEISDAIGGL